MSSGEVCKHLHITPMTLKRWKDDGKIQYKKFSERKYLYDADSAESINTIDDRQNAVYARVSNTKQQNDLDRQIRLIKEYMISNGNKPDHVFSDVASGMNENRTDLHKLMELVTEKKIKKVYISYKDRLTRFGFDYFTKFFGMYGTEIEVINLTSENDFQNELTEDLVSIIHHFSMKMYSNRRKTLKLMKQELENPSFSVLSTED